MILHVCIVPGAEANLNKHEIGMMEWWKNGIMGMKRDDVLILFSMRAVLIKADLIPPNPAFQHSNIPVPHGIGLR